MTAARRSFAVYGITRHGLRIAERLLPGLPADADLYVSERLLPEVKVPAKPMPLPMGPLLSDTFPAYDCHVFLISVGAVVRMIAPLMQNKKVDPAVVCVDDAARFSICVLSGHVGRGNAFTDRVAECLGAISVVSTASDAIGTLTVDILGRAFGWTLADPDHNVTKGCAAVVNSDRVLFVQETGEPDFWPLERPLPSGVAYTTSLDGVDPNAWDMILMASDRDLARLAPRHYAAGLVYRPKSLVLGLGCDRDTKPELVERGIRSMLAEEGLAFASVKSIASVDKKADEPALLALSAKHGWPFVTYPASELDAVPGIENPSAMVLKHVGTRGVAEPAALRAAGATSLLVPKRVYTEPGAGRSMTMAVARLPFATRTETGAHA